MIEIAVFILLPILLVMRAALLLFGPVKEVHGALGHNFVDNCRGCHNKMISFDRPVPGIDQASSSIP